MLEGLHTRGDLLINIKDKRLNQVYKGPYRGVVKIFDWNDDFMKKAEESTNFEGG